MIEKNNKYGVWSTEFQNGYQRDAYIALAAKAKFETDFFLATTQSQLTDVDPVLDAWAESPQGKDLLVALTIDIQSHIRSVSDYSLPAHDIRQIEYKDAVEGLRFYKMEKPQGFKSTFMIPMISHDIGRLLEGRFFHPDNLHENWIPHSQLSYILLKAIFDKPEYKDIPQSLKNHFLYAVAAHSGENGKTYMARAVQTCDRMQLIGPEGFLRAISYVVCLMEGGIKYPVWQSFKKDLPEMKDHTSVLSLLEYFSRNMRENIGTVHPQWQRRVAIENVALLMMACHDNDDLKGRFFAPELDSDAPYGSRKQKIPDDILRAAKDLYDLHSNTYQMLSSQFDVTRKILDLLQKPDGSAKLTDVMKINMNRAMGVLMHNERHSLYQALCLAETLRTQQDGCDREVIASIGHEDPEYIQLIAEESFKYCPELQSPDLEIPQNISFSNPRPV
jgi:hypothetical protein